MMEWKLESNFTKSWNALKDDFFNITDSSRWLIDFYDLSPHLKVFYA